MTGEQALPSSLDSGGAEQAAPRASSKKLLVSLIVLVVLAVGGWQTYLRWPRGDAAPAYTFTSVQRGDLVVKVTASGTLKPVVQVSVGSQVSGRVSQLLVDFNDEVKKGQLLAVIDPDALASNVTQAQARVVAARADVARAQAQAAEARAAYNRVAGLGESGAVARADVSTAESSLLAADAAVGSAKAQVTLSVAALEQARTNLTYTKIVSPIDGVVISRAVELGQTVAASLSAPELFVLAENLKNMEVHTSVSESDVGRVTTGQKVEFTVDAFPDRTFAGKVKQVRYQATTVQNVVTYDAVVEVGNDELLLRPGMTATVSFIVDERRDVPLVSSAALRFRPASAAKGRNVYVLENGQPVAIPVEVGLTDGASTEIVKGQIAPGAQVITGDGTGKPAAGAAAGGAQRQGSSGSGGQRRQSGPPRLF